MRADFTIVRRKIGEIMKLANQRFLRYLTFRSLVGRPGRSIVLFLGISLMVVMLTTLFYVMVGIHNGMAYEVMKTVGSSAHGSFKTLSEEEYRSLSKDPLLKSSAERLFLGTATVDNRMLEVSYLSPGGLDWVIKEKPKGRYPRRSGEVYLDRQTMTALGAEHIGDHISLTVDVQNKITGERLRPWDCNLEVVGYYTAAWDSHLMPGQIYLSHEDATSFSIPKANREMQVVLYSGLAVKMQLMQVAKHHQLALTDQPGDPSRTRLGVNSAYFGNQSWQSYVKEFWPFFLILFLILLGAYLLISNVFYMAMATDTRYLGLLKVVGMTHRQMSQMVYREGLYLTIPALCLGNMLGGLLGQQIMRQVMAGAALDAPFTGYRWIFLLSAFFSIFTVLISCRRPARQAARLSPLASLYVQTGKQHTRLSHVSLPRLAARQVFASKVRYAWIVLSLSLGALIGNGVYCYAQSTDLDKVLNEFIRSDFLIADPAYFRYRYYGSEESLSLKCLNELQMIPQSQGGAIYYEGIQHEPDLRLVGQSKVLPVVYGVDSYLLEKQTYLEGQFSKVDWAKGKQVVLAQKKGEISSFHPGDQMVLKMGDKKIDLKVMAIIEDNFSINRRYGTVYNEDKTGLNLYLLPQDYEYFLGKRSIMSYGLDVDNHHAEKKIKAVTETYGMTYDSLEKQEKSFTKGNQTIQMAGYALALFLALIGLLNLLNIIATDLLVYRWQFAVMEAIGMTGRQAMRLRLIQCFYYMAGTWVLSIVLWIVSAEWLLRPFFEALPYMTPHITMFGIWGMNIVYLLIGMGSTLLLASILDKKSLIERMAHRD